MAKGNIGEIIEKILEKEFWDEIESKEGKLDRIEFYNEESLQFELGYYLRTHLTGYNVYIERNTKDWVEKENTTKHECDIILINKNDSNEKYAIELKYPRNGQNPESMYSFVKDILYMEELKGEGFADTFVLTLADDKGFYELSGREGEEDDDEKGFSAALYKCFRGVRGQNENEIKAGTIKKDTIFRKPTGKNKGSELKAVRGTYNIVWKRKLRGYSLSWESEGSGKDIYAYCLRIPNVNDNK